MKKIIFTAYSLDMGGIEKALVSLLKHLDYNKYQVTLLVEKKMGIFLKDIPEQVKIKEYKVSYFKISIIRKIINRLKLITTIILNYHKFDFACCYATYSIPGGILTRYFSRNSALWVHLDYYYYYDCNKEKMKKFFEVRKINQFRKIIFVAKESMDNFLNIYPELKEKTLVCNNIVDYKTIQDNAKAKVKEKKPSRPLIVNVSRHDEHAKRLSRLIIASKKLIDDGYDFEVWLIGDGKDSKTYKKLIKDLEIGNRVKMLGSKKNPYPYYKMADAYALTSEYEGFPVVFIEALIFDVPIITTVDVTDDMLDLKKDYGILVDKDVNGVYKGMAIFLKKGLKLRNKFDPQRFNDIIINKIEKLLDDGDKL